MLIPSFEFGATTMRMTVLGCLCISLTTSFDVGWRVGRYRVRGLALSHYSVSAYVFGLCQYCFPDGKTEFRPDYWSGSIALGDTYMHREGWHFATSTVHEVEGKKVYV